MAVQSARHDSRLKFLPITWALGKLALVLRQMEPVLLARLDSRVW